jgi:hypothetical protein
VRGDAAVRDGDSSHVDLRLNLEPLFGAVVPLELEHPEPASAPVPVATRPHLADRIDDRLRALPL